MNWEGQVVWITGASSGIGEALAHALARRGSRLILSARNQVRLSRVRAACAGSGAHLVVPLDMADESTLAPAAARALDHFGAVDVLVHNAAISQRALARDTLVAVDRRIFETNFMGVVALTKAVLPSMLARRSGRIVVVSSLAGKVGIPRASAYCASKHALHGYFDTLRAETWRDGLRVTVVCPGVVRTEVSLNALTGDGSPHGVMDPGQATGMSSADSAEGIVRAVESGKDEVVVTRRARYYVNLKHFLPGFYNRRIRMAPQRAQ